jgi:serine/threonine-protein kinase
VRFAVLTLCLWSAAGQTLYRTEPFAGSGYAGDGRSATLAPLLQPQGLAVDRDGSIVVADAADHRIRRITPNGLIYTIAGDGVAGFSGDGLPAGVSRVQTPYGIAIGPNRELYIADLGNGRVRVVSPDGIIRTFAGGGEQLPSADPVKPTNAKLSQPRNVAVDANGTVYISDFGANRVYRVGGDGLLVTVAGTGESGESEDGPANKGKFKGPAGLVIDPTGSLYVADSGNHRVRKIAKWLDGVNHRYLQK